MASQAAVSAAAHAMAAAPGGASSSTVSPGVSRTDLSLLRGQIDAASAVQLTFDKRITGLSDRIVAHELSLQSAVAEITSLALVANNGVRELGAQQMAAEGVLRADIQSAVVRLEGTACMCSAGCPGRLGLPPGISTEAPLLQPSETRIPRIVNGKYTGPADGLGGGT